MLHDRRTFVGKYRRFSFETSDIQIFLMELHPQMEKLNVPCIVVESNHKKITVFKRLEYLKKHKIETNCDF